MTTIISINTTNYPANAIVQVIYWDDEIAQSFTIETDYMNYSDSISKSEALEDAIIASEEINSFFTEQWIILEDEEKAYILDKCRDVIKHSRAYSNLED